MEKKSKMYGWFVLCWIFSGSFVYAAEPAKKKPTSLSAKPAQKAPTSRPTVKAVVGTVRVTSVRVDVKPKTSPRKVPKVYLPALSPMRRYFIRPARSILRPRKGKPPVHPYNIALLTERLQKAPKSLVNKEIIIEGLVVRGDARSMSCTLMLCSKAFPCCNRCNQPLLLRDTWGKKGFTFGGTYKGRYIGCAGTECMQRCAPLVPGKAYRLVVQVKKLDIMSATKLSVHEQFVLHLVSFRPL